jgi:DNA-binding transcriptional ArsR family regulator
MRTEGPPLLPIFRSAGQAAVLSTIYLASAPMSVQEVAERASVSYPTGHREIAKLLEAGIVSEERVGNTRLIRANEQSPYFDSLHDLVEIAFGPVPVLRELLGEVRGLRSAVIFGSYAARAKGIPGPAPEDIDVAVIVADDDYDIDGVYDACEKASGRVRREVRPMLTTVAAWESDDFFDGIRNGPTIELFSHLARVSA